MVFSLPEYAFHDGEVGCEHCHRKSHLKIGDYVESQFGGSVGTTKPVSRFGHPRTEGGRFLSIEPVVPPELVLGDSRKVPDEPRQDLESAVKCLEIKEYRASAILLSSLCTVRAKD